MKNKDLINQLLEKARTKKFQEEQSKGLIKSIGDEIKGNLTPKNIEDVAVNMGNEIKDALIRSIGELNLNDHVSKATESINITVPEVKIPEIVVNVPEVKLPTINVPEPKVTVNVPDFPKIPDFPRIEMPNVMEIFGKLDYDYKDPLPVRLVSLDGKPYESVGGGIGGGSSSGSGRVVVSDILTSSGSSVIDNDGFVKVTGNFSVTAAGASSVSLVNADGLYYNSDNPLPVSATFSAAAVQPVSQVSGQSFSVFATFDTTSSLYNADNRLRVSLETGGSGLTDSELRATHLDVQQLSGNIDSVSVKDIFGSTITTGVVNSDNRIRVSVETGGSGLTDSELRASHLDVQQLSGTIDSVFITGASGTIGVVTIDPDGNPKYSSASSGLTDTELRASHLDVQQVSGAIDSVNVVSTVGLTDTQLRASTLDVKQVSGSIDSVSVTNTVTVSATDLDVRDLVNATDSVSAYQVSGANYSVNVTNASIPVTATDLDIRDLVAATDAVTAYQVSGASYSVTVNGTPTVSVTDVFGSVGSNVVNPDGRLKVELPTGSSGLTDTELRASGVPVSQVSGANWSTSVVSISDIFSTTSASTVVNPDNRVRVELPAGSSGLTDTELRASHLDVQQVSGAIDSVNVLTMPAVVVTSVTNTIAAAIVDSTGVQITSFGGGTQYAEGATASTYTGTAVMFAEASSDAAKVVSSVDPLPSTLSTALDQTIDSIAVRQVSGVTDSVSVVTITDIFSTTTTSNVVNPDNRVKVELPATTVTVSSITSSAAAVLTRQTNPTAVAADYVPLAADDLGRQLTRPIQVRDLIRTAYVSLTTGTETTLLAGVAGKFNDLVMITATNNSTAATQLDLRCTTAGNVVHTMYLPASTGPVGFAPSVPWPQDATGNNWTIDMPDQTGTTVYVSALFSEEI